MGEIIEKEENKEEEISEDLKNLVLERLDKLPPSKRFFIGSDKNGFKKKDLMEHVEKEDEIGKDIIDMEMSFLRALKDGTLLRALNEVN